jgi:hypothetical protein
MWRTHVGEARVGGGVGRGEARAEVQVGLVPELPGHAAALEVPQRRHGEACEAPHRGLARRRRAALHARRRPAEDPERPHAVGVQPVQQGVVAREVEAEGSGGGAHAVPAEVGADDGEGRGQLRGLGGRGVEGHVRVVRDAPATEQRAARTRGGGGRPRAGGEEEGAEEQHMRPRCCSSAGRDATAGARIRGRRNLILRSVVI